ncbi:hypothetical protein [Galbibacter pacificus]|uniref:Uncharacterized protein n=1 Tax=Galbibacter pacificus TaxID=2996052 RepID=A0ABT6FRN0_9FLAO|nr:hypothetical protein [Galbibacter pacificus]MDG3582949.1 hypothetical protein [Galbibacter pacificus]MDG3585932.1 hypothetical protein [Galbibacter pacificus]
MESAHQDRKLIGDYKKYLKFKQLQFTNAQIAEQLDYSKQELANLISTYTFRSNLEYKLQEEEGDYYFNGVFYVTQTVRNTLTANEILEIYIFTQDLVEQHKGIDYLQVFYLIEHDCKLFFIDQLSKAMIESNQYSTEDNYCTLMLSSEY